MPGYHPVSMRLQEISGSHAQGIPETKHIHWREKYRNIPATRIEAINTRSAFETKLIVPGHESIAAFTLIL
jgi:hypothetical protein